MRSFAKRFCTLLLALTSIAAHADAIKLFDDGELAIVAATRPGIVEPLVPVFRNGNLVGSFQTLEAYDRVAGTLAYPLTMVGIVSSDYLRLTYQLSTGASGALGSSVIATPSLRTGAGLELIPTIGRADLRVSTAARFDISLQGGFASGARVVTGIGYADPPVGASTARVDVALSIPSDIALAAGEPFVGNDRARLLTLSSMYASPTAYDANLLRFVDAGGVVRSFALSDATPRGANLFPAPVEVGSWLDLFKSPGSNWFPDSPSLHVVIADRHGLRLGVQGFLAATTDPNADSLSVWLEWMDAPDVVSGGTTLSASFAITAQPVPEPPEALLLLAGLALLCGIGHVHRANPRTGSSGHGDGSRGRSG